MARPKSLVSTKLKVDHAKKSHNCQHNENHRISMGEKRLKIPVGRSHDHYCVECAEGILRRGIDRLQALLDEIRED